MSKNEAETLFTERLNRVNSAIRLEKTDRVPIVPFVSSYIQRSHESSYADIFYDFNRAGDATVEFYKEHPLMDVGYVPLFNSGRANEMAGSTMIDWPGRPGTRVDKYSSHQVIEQEYMTPDEYPELLKDYTGFMLRKYIPRAYPNIKGTENLSLISACILNTTLLSPFGSPAALEAFSLISKIAAEDAKSMEATLKYTGILADMGFPSFFCGLSEAPYDILGDYFRGTMGIFEDVTDEDMYEYIDQACDMFADLQIQSLQYLRYVDMPAKRIFFPLHKAMDGFLNDAQFERFYWKPLKKIMMALIDMDVTPYIYTEGPYNSRLEFLTDVPKGKVLYHFETVDMKEAKRILGGTAAICGNLPVSRMEFGTKEEIEDMVKRLLDDCAPDGGYLFDFNGSLENCKPENLDIMFETLDKYGRY